MSINQISHNEAKLFKSIHAGQDLTENNHLYILQKK